MRFVKLTTTSGQSVLLNLDLVAKIDASGRETQLTFIGFPTETVVTVSEAPDHILALANEARTTTGPA